MINFNVGIYIRLSQEDEKDGDSESVINQKSLLMKYINSNGYNLYKVYVDDGYTGTNFDRPGFKEMIKDILDGYVNMVVTKDLSRLGRDYIETGEYVEKWFPMHNVRYVSLLDGVDTFFDNNNNEIAPFKAVINDMYSRENSKKIRAALHSMQDDGKWVGGCTPFGYMKDPNDKNHLVINEEEAPIVRKIFEWAGDGYSPFWIRNKLIEEGVPTAKVIREKKGSGLWCTKTIQGILSNQLYTGDMVQNRRSRISYKIRKVVANRREDWKIVEGTHEAFVDKKEFERIQRLIKSSNRSSKKIIRCLDGLLYCYECGHRITVNSPRKSDGRTYIACNYYRQYSKLNLCTSHGFNYDNLEDAVLRVCRKLFGCLNIDYLKEIVNNNVFDNKLLDLKKDKARIEELISKGYNNIDKIYMDNIAGKIDDDMYKRVSDKIRDELSCNEKKLNDLDKMIDKCLIVDNSKYDGIFFDFLKLLNPTRDIMIGLINKIEVHNDKVLDIYFNFRKLDFF